MKPTRAFTLTELLVIIAIIAVLCVLCAPLVKTMNLTRDKAVALKNLRELSVGLSTYTFQHDGELPLEGESQPSWESAADPKYNDAWYNAIPRLLGKRGVGDYGPRQESYYSKANLLYIPAAQYPRDRRERESRPYFAVSINSKLRRKDSDDATARITNIEYPASTVIFQESGLPDEKPLPGQGKGAYDGQSKSYATRTVARYSGKTLLIFADGHVGEMEARDIVNSDGKAYMPQKGSGGGAVYWTIDPEADPND